MSVLRKKRTTVGNLGHTRLCLEDPKEKEELMSCTSHKLTSRGAEREMSLCCGCTALSPKTKMHRCSDSPIGVNISSFKYLNTES